MRVGEGLSKYEKYLASPFWLQLKEKYIYSKKSAKCFICEKTYTLLLHHVKYQRLGKEQLLKIHLFHVTGDVVIVCFDCHTKIHFIKLLGFIKIRVPLKKYLLVKRMLFLRLVFLLGKHRLLEGFITFLFYIL
jgi:hypothetical protein